MITPPASRSPVCPEPARIVVVGAVLPTATAVYNAPVILMSSAVVEKLVIWSCDVADTVKSCVVPEVSVIVINVCVSLFEVILTSSDPVETLTVSVPELEM